MSVNELKAKYGRIANDPSQLEMFKDDVIEGKTTGFPELPEGAEGKTLVLQMQDGELSWQENSSSTIVIEKGTVIKLAGEDYRVLSVNDDLTDCEVMHVGPATLSKFRNTSPNSDPSAGVAFMVDGIEKIGLKYEGSLLDQICETFYEGLPADVKAAIIEQEVEQDMYNTNAAEGTEDFSIDNSVEGGIVHRFKKINDTPVVVGARHAYALSCGAIKEYFGGTSTHGIEVAKVFQLHDWFKDANSSRDSSASCLSCDGGGVYVGSHYLADLLCVCPAFHIDLTKVNL